MDDQRKGEMSSKKEEFDPAPVDSSSKEWAFAAGDERKMLWEDGVSESPLSFQLVEILDLAAYTAQTVASLREVYEHGVSKEEDFVTVKITSEESQAVSFGLNLVGFFLPELREESKSLLLRVAEAVTSIEMTEEHLAQIEKANQEIHDERLAKFMGFESMEEFRAARAEAQKHIDAKEVEDLDSEIAKAGGKIN